MRSETQQRRYIGRVESPGALPVTHQACDRAGQVVGVVIRVQAQAQGVFEHTDRLRLVGINILDFTPGLAITQGAISSPAVEQAIVAIGLLQRQGQVQDRCLISFDQQLRQLQCRRQAIYLIGVHQSAIGHAYTHLGGLEFPQAQGVHVEPDPQHTPRVYLRQMRQAFVGPSLPARLLLELLRRQQGSRCPQGAVDFHHVIP